MATITLSNAAWLDLGATPVSFSVLTDRVMVFVGSAAPSDTAGILFGQGKEKDFTYTPTGSRVFVRSIPGVRAMIETAVAAVVVPQTRKPPTTPDVAMVGQAINPVQADWYNPVDSRAWLWKRDGVSLGVTTLPYTPVVADAAKTLTVEEVATNSAGASQPVVSSPIKVAPAALTITASPPTMNVGEAWSVTPVVAGGRPPYRFFFSASSFPNAQFTRNYGTGMISGTPTSNRRYSVVINVQDADGMTRSVDIDLVANNGTVPNPTLVPLAVSNSAGTVGQPFNATISNKAAGSTLSLTGSGSAGLNVSGVSITGTPTTAGAINIVETLSGATNSPRTTSGLVTIAAAPAAGAFLSATSVAPAAYVFIDKMNPSYSGFALQVKRASDGAISDIGFDANGKFNASAASTFQQSSYLTVVKGYSQDGSGMEFLTSGQPRLWLGDGGPTIESYASAQPFIIPAALSLQRNACSVVMVGRTPGLGATNGYFMFGDPGVPNNDFGMTTARTSGQVGMQPMVGGSTIAPTTANKATQPVANLSIQALLSGSDKITIHRDEQTGVFPAAAALTMNAGGQIGGGNTYIGRHSLKGFAFYPAALSDADATALKGVLKNTFNTASAPARAMHAQGDSIIFGTGGVNNFTITAAMAVRLGPTVLLRNNGIAGHQLSQHYQDYNNASTRSRFIVEGVENTYFSDYGHNDIKALVTDSATASSVVATMQTQIKAMCADLRLAGYAKIIWQETFPDVASGWTADMETARNNWNAFLRSNPTDANGAACFDAVDRVASDTNFIFGDAETAAGRGMRLTSISSDGVHPNESVAGARADHLIATYNAIGTTQPVTPTVTLSAPVTQNEGNSGPTLFTYTVTRSATTGATSVPWTFSAGTTSADDFTGGAYPAGGSVSLADGVASGSFSVSVNGDTTVEPTETFTVSITAPSGYASGANMTATGTITNDDASASPGIVVEDMKDNFSATDVTAFNAVLPATINPGDLLIALVAIDGNSTLTWDNTTAGAWTQRLNDVQTQNRLMVFSKTADGTEDGKTLALAISAAQQLVVRFFRLSGTTGEISITGTGNRSTAATSYDQPAVTASWGAANNFFLTAAALDNGVSITSGPSGYSSPSTINTSSSGQAGITSAYKVANAATDDPGPFVSSTSIAWIATTIAVRPS